MLDETDYIHSIHDDMMTPQLSAEKRSKLVDRLEQMKVHELPELKPALQARLPNVSRQHDRVTETSCAPVVPHSPSSILREVSKSALTFAYV